MKTKLFVTPAGQYDPKQHGAFCRQIGDGAGGQLIISAGCQLDQGDDPQQGEKPEDYRKRLAGE